MENKGPEQPVVLELAQLPREQVGPFLLLGLEKDAGKEQIEAHWAKRIIWGRKNQLSVPLEDINWAREYLNDRERRARADAGSLNPDTAEGVLRHLQKHYGGVTDPRAAGRASWQPWNVEKPLADYAPATEIPNMEDVQAAIPEPVVPQEVPAAAALLEYLAQQPLDPWALPELD